MPWPKGKPRSIDTRTKMCKNGILPEARSVCACGSKKDPYSPRCRTCWESSDECKALGKIKSYTDLSAPKTAEHRKRLSESNRGKHNHFSDKNPNWRGGVSTLNHLLRTCEKYRVWQLEVIKAHKNICSDCQKSVWFKPRKGYACHHVKSFRVLIQEAVLVAPELPAMEACLNYDPLWDPTNGKLLHRECHLELHKELAALND